MITREEYLNQMQSYREELQENSKAIREHFDLLEDDYRKKKQKLFENHEEEKRNLKKMKLYTQHEIEKKMHELKVQWAKEHPYEEVKVVNND